MVTSHVPYIVECKYFIGLVYTEEELGNILIICRKYIQLIHNFRCHAWINHFSTMVDIKRNVITFCDIYLCILI